MLLYCSAVLLYYCTTIFLHPCTPLQPLPISTSFFKTLPLRQVQSKEKRVKGDEFRLQSTVIEVMSSEYICKSDKFRVQ